MRKLLEVKGLKTYFYYDEGIIKAVDGMDFEAYDGKTLAIVGESGCGKSVTAKSIMQLIPTPGKIVAGDIKIYNEESNRFLNITELKPKGKKMRKIRGNKIAMIFQEPMNSLSPVHSIGNQIIEAIRLHQDITKQQAREKTIDLLRKTRLSRPKEVVDEYIHQLSGGMRQRAMVALALSCEPSLLIADEPTTALDVTIQAQILQLIKDLQNDMGMGVILITHDLGVVSETADSVGVTYLGRILEYGGILAIFNNPLHPYTQALFDSIPKLKGTAELSPIEGSVPDPFSLPSGCTFKNRCPQSINKCSEEIIPDLLEIEPGHKVRCLLKEGKGVGQ